jgi:hypothetical protein
MVLDRHHSLGDVIQRLLGIGQRQQVVHVLPAQAGEAEMVRDPHRLHPADQRLEIVEVAAVERVDRADRERHAMQRHRIVAADAVEPVHGAAARHHVVLRQRLEPAHPPGAGGDLFVMLGPQSQPETDLGAHLVDSNLFESPNIRDFSNRRFVVLVTKDVTEPLTRTANALLMR